MAIIQKLEKAIYHKKDSNYQKQGNARQFKKQESAKKIVIHKADNFWSRRVQFAI